MRRQPLHAPVPTAVVLLAALLLATLLAPVAAQGDEGGASARIINGEPTERFDAMAVLRTPAGSPFCGGTLVHPEWVLTAAHCVFEEADAADGQDGRVLVDRDAFFVTVGLEDAREDDADATDNEVDEIVVHPGWDTTLPPDEYVVQSDDVALLRLKDPVPAPPLRFADVDEAALSRVGVTAVVHGYGYNNRGEASDYRGSTEELRANGTSPELLSTEVPVVECRVEPGLLCAGDLVPYDGSSGGGASQPPANDNCNGDSGGPLTVDDGAGGRIQVGIVSYGFARCGYTDGEPAAYTSTASYGDFIHDTIGPLALLVVPDAVVEGATAEVAVEVLLARPLRDGQPDEVTLSTRDVTAVADRDYEPVDREDLDVSSGRATLVVPLLDDDVHEDDELLLVLADDSKIPVVGGPSTVTIRDDDVYEMTGEGATVAEPRGAPATATLRFTLDEPAAGFERFRLVRSGGDATSGSDVSDGAGIVRFAAGAQWTTTTVEVFDDDEVEATEDALYVVRDAVGVTVPDKVRVTIKDDDEREVRVLGGSDRLATAIAVSQDAYAAGGAEAVVIASARSFPDALVGTPFAVARKGPLLLSEPDGIDQRVLDEVRRVLVEGGLVHILGGERALGADVAAGLEAAGFTVNRIAGGTRYDTAAKVANRLGDVSRIFLATGRNYPDALAAGAAAAKVGGVVLLTDDDEMPQATATILATFTGNVTAVGGQAAGAAGDDEDLVGSTRYDTARLVAETFFVAPVSVGLATGESFPDALAGGVAAARRGGPLVLTPGRTLSPTTAAYLDAAQPDLVRVFGGSAAVDDAVVERVADLTGGRIVR